MKRTMVSMLALLLVSAMADLARADDADVSSQRLQRLITRFHQADVNGDGQLTREEARQGMPRVYRHFSEIDTENKGYVTVAQIASYLEAHPKSARTTPPPTPAPPAAATPPPAAQ